MHGTDPLNQSQFDIRCEWGLHGVQTLAPISDVIVIVDVLSFTTCVDIATANGAAVFPYASHGDAAGDYARARNALLAGPRGAAGGGYSLSPAGLLDIPARTRLVLPSPNGSTLSVATGAAPTLAGCLRNSRSVAAYAGRIGRTVSVIACGERWPDGSLRPAVEDLIGAGAIISQLGGSKSPEARAAEAVFESSRGDLGRILAACASGQELIGRGFSTDVDLSGRLDCSTSAPLLRGDSYLDMNSAC
ncbi:MAG: 2-phosphosulfolactate phosphatase [Spirochaetaceae bacterium]|nr:2-phosphosulfolactate phosphatase [Spirochaetaceae bacterium]